MALTELQLPTKADFYRNIQHAATEMDNLIQRWRNLAEFIGLVDVDDLDAMGVATGAVRTDLVEFRTVLNEVIALYDGSAVTPTNPPNAVIDKVRMM